MQETYPFRFHPCWSAVRDNLWKRIHLPVARMCNVKCIFCDHTFGSACHTSRPGTSSQIMTPSEAVAVFIRESKRVPDLRIAAISGPGEPLYNQETFSVLEQIREIDETVKFCLSTNGVLLQQEVSKLVQLEVSTVSVSLHAVVPETVQQIYEWAKIGSEVMKEIKMGETVLKKQLCGISSAVDAGISVKVNTVLIPSINLSEIAMIADTIAGRGVQLHNVVPLIKTELFDNIATPSKEQLQIARESSAKYICQFYHCAQCRSDVVGIPGADRIL